jgi:glutaredoxin 3
MEYLSQKGVAFTEKNVGRDPQARQELLSLGLTSLPVVIVGEQRLSGFNPARIDAALAAAGLP